MSEKKKEREALQPLFRPFLRLSVDIVGDQRSVSNRSFDLSFFRKTEVKEVAANRHEGCHSHPLCLSIDFAGVILGQLGVTDFISVLWGFESGLHDWISTSMLYKACLIVE